MNVVFGDYHNDCLCEYRPTSRFDRSVFLYSHTNKYAVGIVFYWKKVYDEFSNRAVFVLP